jgi:hypothetical protein
MLTGGLVWVAPDPLQPVAAEAAANSSNSDGGGLMVRVQHRQPQAGNGRGAE